ncbi:hypothetical protein BHE74_00055230 [Ensete ventricosum]|nr:hypothetical protein BHE74_00055230 [Ensete ventricosum]
MTDFNHRRRLSGDNDQFRPSLADFGRYQPREKKGRTWRSDAALPILTCHPRASRCFVGRMIDDRGEKKTTRDAQASR